MSVFEYLSVAISLVIGISLTQLLASGLHLFASREDVEWDWIPICWAVLCFGWQLQYWWAIYEFSQLPRWTFGSFLLLVLSAVLLYASSGLMLPRRTSGQHDLEAHFRAEGRWGVLFLMVYFLSAFAVGPVLWGSAAFFAPEALPMHAMNLSCVCLGLAVFFVASRRARSLLTMLSIAVQGMMYFWSVPWVY